jgi:glucose-6-phosphate 1-dehydrogenase
VKLSNVTMDFAYEDYFRTAPNPGYETLIYDCMIDDATLFQRADNIDAGWAAVQAILGLWAESPPFFFQTTPLAVTALPRLTSYLRATVASGGLWT